MFRGKLAPNLSPDAAHVGRLWAGSLPPIPTLTDWGKDLVHAPMFLNDRLNCCTWAAQANRIRVLTKLIWDDEYVLPNEALQAGYLGMTGGPNTPLYTTDVLTHFATKGLVLPDRQVEDVLIGWAALDHASFDAIRQGVDLFQGASIGFRLPRMADTLFSEGRDWDLPTYQPLAGDWEPSEGHEVFASGQSVDGLWVHTWGERIFVTKAFLNAYVDEAYVSISPLQMDQNGLSADRLDLDYLKYCLAKVARAV